ncbi:MAG: lipase family protein [Pseudomonadota bacterium]
MSKTVNPYNTKLDAGNAYWMARLSHVAYMKDDDDFPDEQGILADLQQEDADFISVTGASESSAQAILVEHANYLCMAFRGTDHALDWLDNLKIFKTSVLFGEFHLGFWSSMQDIWGPISGRYHELRQQDMSAGSEPRPLFLTGHSLGGAMATCAASSFIDEDKPYTSIYTFGAPRSVSRSTARIYNSEARDRHYRFQNNQDIVSRVPTRTMGFSHVGNCLYIDSDQTIHFDPSYWLRFLDRVEGALDSVKQMGEVGLVDDHALEEYLEAIEKWDTSF